MHMFNMLAVENRVIAFHLANDTPIGRVEDTTLKYFRPGLEDNEKVRKV
jgi:hypothetical protein